MKYKLGSNLLCFGSSIHAGQKGILVADYGDFLLLKADDEKYSNASKNSGREGKYFQVDALLVKQLKE